MPRYDYRCATCGEEFEVSRSFAQASDPVTCPVDSADCVRIPRMPMVFVPGKAASAPAPAPSADWSHHGHSHGTGAGAHSH